METDLGAFAEENGKKMDIQIPNIEKELNKGKGHSLEKKQVKACLFTLIIYAHEQRRIQYLQDLIDTVLDKFPCRIIFLQCNEHQEFLHVSVANVQSGHETAMVTCDQITIEASKDQLFRIPYIIMPHIVPDLPVYLIWSQPPFEESTIFTALKPFASRLIFDSECSDNLHLFCQEMEQTLHTSKIDVMDINWALISNWRDMLVQMFDTPQKVQELQNCTNLTICYNDTKSEIVHHPEIRAIYLQGWLASRLGWKFKTSKMFNGDLVITYDTAEQEVAVTLSPRINVQITPRSIISFDMNLANNCSFVIMRKQSISQVVIHASSSDKCEIPYTLPLPDVHRGLLFMKEIFYHKLSSHYSEMLKMISNINYV